MPVFSVIIDQVGSILKVTDNGENSQKLYIHFEKERRKNHEKTHSYDWEILCGVDKGTYTESSIGCGCFDWNG